MREIKFRGKWLNGDKKMIYGNLIQSKITGYSYIENVIVDPESVGQYIGIKDKNYKEIYEGDILGLQDSGDDSKFIVEYYESSFQKKYLGEKLPTAPIRDFDLTGIGFVVIGNIYDNPELLKEE